MAAATRRIITAMLFGLRPLDTAAYAGVLLLAVPVIVLAAIVPAVRAARVDPMIALREP
jgi:ABC-type lipoprotein release transport system permease subunit